MLKFSSCIGNNDK